MPTSSEPADLGDPAARHLPAVVAFYERLRPEDLPVLGRLYARDARFKDPFNDVTGLDAITRIFAHMFEQLDAPRFEFEQQLASGRVALLTWTMHFRFRGERDAQVIRGATELRFDGEGRIALHRDYWDAAEELYEKLPLLGALMRWLKRRANA